jgi:hypothetical protein
MASITAPDRPGERLVVCRNPRAVQRSIHPGAKGESTMQQLRETCEPA